MKHSWLGRQRGRARVRRPKANKKQGVVAKGRASVEERLIDLTKQRRLSMEKGHGMSGLEKVRKKLENVTKSLKKFGNAEKSEKSENV